ncbi:MAG: amino acid adenylation domain-containing protein, partial [Clostridia bacterium]|nr:amino acid adenylation domain-containing protein [Clostridia bacterium]
MLFGLDIILDGDKVLFEIEYDPTAYSEYTINGITRLMDQVINEFLTKENISDISFVSNDDEKAILSLHDTDFKVEEKPAYRLLQDSAEKYPDRNAVIAVDRTLTYRELNEEANALGHLLRDNGAQPETIVAVMAERDSYAYIMRQGVLKSGGAFLPIDPEYPEERIRYILENSNSKLLVTTASVIEKRKDLLEALSNEGVTIINVQEAVSNGDKNNLNIDVPYEALAYVIYTSGSTGKPKGVMLTNKNLVNFVDANEKNHEILGYTERGHVSLAIAALTFDFSIMEEFVPVANGLTVVLASSEQIMDAITLSRIMLENNVDIMSCTPSYLLNMMEIDAFAPAVKQLKSIDFGAEAFPPALFTKLRKLNPDLYIMNGYGPTEATISCTMQVIENADDITIGIPNVNMHVATIDRDKKLQPMGALGEMVIMGDGVGRGYVGREDLTKESFIKLLGKNAYRSGDLVRIREDGNIEFHGRIDNQVKLRGLRVELGEIESVINSYEGIRSSIVIVAHGETDYLAAYFTANREIDINSLKEHLSAYLTAYMVPQAFMQLDEMPLTANGKIDKKVLPVIEIAEEEIVPAENEMQDKILGIAKEVTGADRIGITTD